MGKMACTDKCPAFSANETVCAMSGFCKWNDKYAVCYTEEQSSFTEIVIEDNVNPTSVIEALEQSYEGIVAVVVEEDGKNVIMVYGNENISQAIRRSSETICAPDDIRIKGSLVCYH